MPINAQDISKLRNQTGAGMMDCKKALEETGGDFDKAIEELRKRGVAKAAKRADKIAAEGIVESYIHAGGKIGVLAEVNCETDFVAQTDVFKSLVKDIVMHIAAAAPIYLNKEDVSPELVEKEKDVYREQLKNEGKPNDIIEKILEGKLEKFYSEICLLKQAFIKNEDQTIGDLLTEKSAEIGEKVVIRRFVRYELGDGIEKKNCDFAAEVEEQLN